MTTYTLPSQLATTDTRFLPRERGISFGSSRTRFSYSYLGVYGIQIIGSLWPEEPPFENAHAHEHEHE